ncbi:MAG: aminopeptidase [Burkholderiaceae bacterium]
MKRGLAIAGAVLAAAAVSLCLSGCANVGYYWQSFSGHMAMLNAARPVGDWLADEQAPPRLKERLALSQRIRDFAASELKLPENTSYRRYADLKRSAVVWNVVAAQPYSLQLKTWCFPVTGCVSYRGYFDEAAARAEAEGLRAEGFEVGVYGVPAYSTLGWMNWAGGDPLLNTFIAYPEGELARMIFHELAHQVLYVKDDTMFNESFATAVERLGGERWLAAHASDAVKEEYTQFDSRRRQFRVLTLQVRRELDVIYKDRQAGRLAEPAAAAAKAEALRSFRERYEVLKAGWGGFAGYDSWVARANNALFGAQAAYDELVPGFESLFEREGRDWQRFYDAARKLAAQPKNERREVLGKPTKETSGA